MSGSVARSRMAERSPIWVAQPDAPRDYAADLDHDSSWPYVASSAFSPVQASGAPSGRHADNVYVVLDGLTRGFRRGREERADIHVEAEVITV